MNAPDIFFSYAREDEVRVAPIVAALEARGWSVFWDRRIPAGKTWRSHIGRALDQTRCVVVAWSEHAIRSEWVIEEADEGRERDILVPAFLDSVRPPRGFRGIQAADLSGWSPEHPSLAFDRFLADLSAVLDVPRSPGASTPDAAPVAAPAVPVDENAANQSTAATVPFMTDCDWLAADPDDSQKHGPGVRWDALDATHAVRACDAALAHWPDEARFVFQYGRALMKADNNPEALLWVRKAADQGYAAAQNNLGDLYMDGRGVEEDEAEAARWYRKAADQGDPLGQTMLGLMYLDERGGLLQDEAEALRWIHKAADQGHPFALRMLGFFYRDENEAEALHWIRKAAEQGDPLGQTMLGLMYLEERGGLLQDEAAALHWIRKAAEHGDPLGQMMLALWYAEGGCGLPKDEAEALRWIRKAIENIERVSSTVVPWYKFLERATHEMAQMTLAEIYAEGGCGLLRDEAEAARWYKKAADQGDAAAQNKLGQAYENGRGVAKSETEAVNWYRKAADQGFAAAQNKLGLMHTVGSFLGRLPKDDAQATTWFRKAADQGYAVAQYNLGWAYENGRGLAKDGMEAVNWYRKAAEQGYSGAQNKLGLLHILGSLSLPKDDAQAIAWFRKAADQGHAAAQNNLAWAYENGRGVAKSETEAVNWYRKAADQGYAAAKQNLARLGHVQ